MTAFHARLQAPSLPLSVIFSFRELSILSYEYEWQLSTALSLNDYAEFLLSISGMFCCPTESIRRKTIECQHQIMSYAREQEMLKRTAVIDPEERAALTYLNRQIFENDTERLKEYSKALERAYLLGGSFESLRFAKNEMLRTLLERSTSPTTIETAQLMNADVFAEDSRLLDLSGKHIRQIFLERRRIETFTTIWKPWLLETRKRLSDFSRIAQVGFGGRIISRFHIQNQYETMRGTFVQLRRSENRSSVETKFRAMLDLSRQLLWMERSWSERMS